MAEVVVRCASCTHPQSNHPVDHEHFFDGFKAAAEAGDFAVGVEVDWKNLLAAECKVLDCPCPAFSPAPLPEGTFVGSNIGEDGYEILSYEPLGPARVCVIDRCAIAEDEPRYRIRILPHLETDDAVDEAEDPVRGSMAYMDDWDPEDIENDPTICFGAAVRFVPSIACVPCIVTQALTGPFPDEDRRRIEAMLRDEGEIPRGVGEEPETCEHGKHVAMYCAECDGVESDTCEHGIDRMWEICRVCDPEEGDEAPD